MGGSIRNQVVMARTLIWCPWPFGPAVADNLARPARNRAGHYRRRAGVTAITESPQL